MKLGAGVGFVKQRASWTNGFVVWVGKDTEDNFVHIPIIAIIESL